MKSYYIEENDAEQRLDKFLKKLFPSASRALLYKLNRTGKIKVLTQEGKKTKQDNEYKLQRGEQVQVFLSDKDIAELRSSPTTVIPSRKHGTKGLTQKDIVFEDPTLLVINKEPGVNVHPGDHKSQEVSLIEQAQDYLSGQKLSSLTFKPSLIHRIDRDTSGIVMIAKDKQTLTKLSTDFKKPSIQLSPKGGKGELQKSIQKTYFALVVGKLSRSEATIKKQLKRIENAKNENKVQVRDDGQEAITHYRVLDEYRVPLPEGEQILSALEVTIETGRMHQIRVHLAHIGNPILGDSTYGDKKLNSYFAKHFGVTRQMLHAWKIAFTHPKRQKKMSLEARLKEDMQGFIGRIKN